MTRDDQIRATVAQGMQDSGVIREAIVDVIKAAFREGDEPWLIADIAHLVAESSMDSTGSMRDWHAIRLLNSMEHYVRSVLNARANDDTPKPDDEENDE